MKLAAPSTENSLVDAIEFEHELVWFAFKFKDEPLSRAPNAVALPVLVCLWTCGIMKLQILLSLMRVVHI